MANSAHTDLVRDCVFCVYRLVKSLRPRHCVRNQSVQLCVPRGTFSPNLNILQLSVVESQISTERQTDKRTYEHTTCYMQSISYRLVSDGVRKYHLGRGYSSGGPFPSRDQGRSPSRRLEVELGYIAHGS